MKRRKIFKVSDLVSNVSKNPTYFTEKIFHLESPPLLDLPKSHPYLLDKLSKKDMWAP